MERNKYIYAQSKCAIVIESSYNKGGTWAGATENLKNNWVRLYVKESNNPNSGNPKLIEQGATKIDNNSINELILLSSLFKDSPIEIIEKYRGETPVTVKTQDVVQPTINIIQYNNIYEIVKSRLKYILKRGPLTIDEIANQLKVNPSITNIWLKKAVSDRLILRKERPVRYYWNDNRQLDGRYGFIFLYFFV
jgi:predicted Rossmann fold nucleotide-binding protein DprA/Smf involved in DNA uptake